MCDVCDVTECFDMELGGVTVAVDVYSFGITLWWVYTHTHTRTHIAGARLARVQVRRHEKQGITSVCRHV